MAVSIMPRALGVLDKGRTIAAQIELKYSDALVKKPKLIRYTDTVAAAA